MYTFLDTIKIDLLEANGIFGQNGFFYKTTYEFEESGVSDRYTNLFYLRQLINGPNKFLVRNEGNIDAVSYKARLVIQLQDSVDKDTAINSIIGQMAAYYEVEITSFSDDIDGIYKAEYGKEVTIRGVYLLSVDFVVTETAVLQSLNCAEIC